MANSDKNILITPATNTSGDPRIVYTPNTAANVITQRLTDSGTISFEGSAGQLFSITNSLTGTLFSVNDISGIPSIDVADTGLVRISPFNGTLAIGSTTVATSGGISAKTSVTTTATTQPGFIVKGILNQSATLFEAQNSVGTSLLSILSTGVLASTVATGTAPLTVASTTKVTNLNADLLDGFDTSQSAATASTVAVRDSNGAINATHLWTSGYRTSNTLNTFVNQWTRIAQFSMLSQYVNSVAIIDFSSDGPGLTEISSGRLFVSVKQQQPLGSPPEPPTMILSNHIVTTIDDFALVLSQNDGTATRFDLYYRNKLDYQLTGFIPIYVNGTVVFYSSQPYVASLPQAYSNTAVNPPETEITPIDNLSNYFDGVTNRYRITHQGVFTSVRNPFRLMISINGVVQTVNTPEYAWQSPIPYDGFFLDNDGFINFSDTPPLGSTFDGRILGGATTSTKTKNYPFRAVDLLIGA